MRSADVYCDGILAGILVDDDEGYSFRYLEEYLDKEGARPISLTMPLSKQAYHSNLLFPFFDGLIPEGWLLEMAINRFGLERNDRMGILLKVGKDVIGNVSVEERHG